MMKIKIAPGFRRYVINFGEMSEEEAWQYPDLMNIVEEKVKPARLAQKDKISQEKWWLFLRTRPELFRAMSQLNRVLVISRVSQHGSFTFLPSAMVFSDSLVVFANDKNSFFCILQSRIHEIWARFFGSSLEDTLRYTPSDCFEAFPFPENWENNLTLEQVGKTYYEYRAEWMVKNNQGLTETYNRFHDPDEYDPDIIKLRELHTAMDKAVLNAYGWSDISTECEFLLDYEEKDFTPDISPTKRGERSKKKPWRYRW
ncbi:MAG: type IIL restriction-modification enzyme MmeI, partial [Sphaerospermopsis kisseleviana]